MRNNFETRRQRRSQAQPERCKSWQDSLEIYRPEYETGAHFLESERRGNFAATNRIEIVIANFYLVKDGEKARLYHRVGEKQNTPDIWIPRSVITHQTKYAAEPGKLPLCVVTVKDWWAEKNEL